MYPPPCWPEHQDNDFNDVDDDADETGDGRWDDERSHHEQQRRHLGEICKGK